MNARDYAERCALTLDRVKDAEGNIRMRMKMVGIIECSIAAAVREETERCAQIAESCIVDVLPRQMMTLADSQHKQDARVLHDIATRIRSE